MPNRIQRKRTAGWTTPRDALGRRAVYVGRPTRWGNPWVVVETQTGWAVNWVGPGGWETASAETSTRRAAHEIAVGLYREWLDSNADLTSRARAGLVGRDLMCWCAEHLPCHVDILLEIVNEEVAA